MGKVMKAVTARLAGSTVDGRTLSEAVKKRLAPPDDRKLFPFALV
jgi:uncharacterized protein YqeY